LERHLRRRHVWQALGHKQRLNAHAAALAGRIALAWPPGAGARFVVCTGGEPLLQLDSALVVALHARGFEVAVETNGTVPPPAGIDWLCVSPKAGAPLVVTAGDELKIVVPQPGLDPRPFAGLAFRRFSVQPMDGPERVRNTDAAIRYCLAEGRIRVSDLDHVGISRDPRANLHKKAFFALSRRPNLSFVRDRLANAARVRDPRRALIETLGPQASGLKATFHNVEHHRAHMASAFYVSPFKDAAILSVDGMGDFVSTMWGLGRGDRMQVLGEINFPHSLGIFYTAVSQWLGFPKYGDEGKVMGLAPYGQPRYLEQMHKLVGLHRDGTFELNAEAFLHAAQGASMSWADGAPTLGTLYSPKMVELLGPPKEASRTAWSDPTSDSNRLYVDVAASLQVMLEEAEFGLVRMLHRLTGQKALCIAGGVGLNSTFNGKVRLDAEFDDVRARFDRGENYIARRGKVRVTAGHIHDQRWFLVKC